MHKNQSQQGSTHVIIIVLIIALIGGLGFVFWNNFLKKEATVSQTESKSDGFCSDGENTAAEKGTFCSKEIGIKFTVPSIFTNKIAKIGNYEVFKGSLDPNTKTSAGSSENAHRAIISGKDNFTLTIAQEPIRTGYVDAFHALQNTYYDQVTGDLTLVKEPAKSYDSATKNFITSGEYSKGEPVPSFSVNDMRFFKGSDGDAGQVENVYFGIVKNKIVKISLKNVGFMGNPASDPTTIDASKVFDELDASIKVLKVSQSS